MKKTLGRGLGALIPGAESSENVLDLSEILGTAIAEKKLENRDDSAVSEGELTEDVKMLKVMQIEPCRTQPRTTFDREHLEALAQSIKTHGIIQPIIVRELPNSANRYEIIAGERRWRASQIAGLTKIPVIIRKIDDENMMELALIENLQRVDLNPIDEALGYRALMDKYKFTQEQISERIGKSRSAIANSLRLLNLPQEIRELIETGDISSGHARALVTLSSENKQKEIAEKIIRNDLSVRATEQLVKAVAKPTKTVSETSASSEMKIYLESVEKNIERIVGSKTKISLGKKKNVIEIEYYTNRDLDRILKVLNSADV